MAQRLFESRRRAACLRYRRSAASYANLPPYKYISLRGSLGAWPLPGQEQGPSFLPIFAPLLPPFLSFSGVCVCPKLLLFNNGAPSRIPPRMCVYSFSTVIKVGLLFCIVGDLVSMQYSYFFLNLTRKKRECCKKLLFRKLKTFEE